MTNAQFISKIHGTGLPANTVLVADGRYLQPLQTDLMGRFGEEVTACPIPSSQPIPAALLANANLLVVEVDLLDPASLTRIADIRENHPALLLIAAASDVDITTVRTLIRRGVQDVVSLPFDAEELFAAIMDLTSRQVATDATLAPMMGILHSSGGCGATTVATHLVAAMAAQQPEMRFCVIDLDLQFGEVSSLLGLDAASNVVDLLQVGDRLDGELLHDIAIVDRQNISVLAAPSDITPPEGVDTDRLLRLLTLARQEFDFVLLDLPGDWTSWALSAACACDQLLMVVDQSIRSLRRTKKSLGLLDSVEFPASSVKIIVNRAEKKMFQVIGTEEVADALRREVIAALPLQKSGLQEAQEDALLLGQVDKRAPFVRAIEALANRLLPEGQDEWA